MYPKQNNYSGPISNTNTGKESWNTFHWFPIFAVTANFKTGLMFLTFPAFSLKQTCQLGLL